MYVKRVLRKSFEVLAIGALSNVKMQIQGSISLSGHFLPEMLLREGCYTAGKL